MTQILRDEAHYARTQEAERVMSSDPSVLWTDRRVRVLPPGIFVSSLFSSAVRMGRSRLEQVIRMQALERSRTPLLQLPVTPRKRYLPLFRQCLAYAPTLPIVGLPLPLPKGFGRS